MTIRKRPK